MAKDQPYGIRNLWGLNTSKKNNGARRGFTVSAGMWRTRFTNAKLC